MANPFAEAAVTYASAAMQDGKNRKDWKSFCILALGAGIEEASALAGLAADRKFKKLYRGCNGDLISAEAWSRWKDGLDYTALADWILAAQ